MRCTYHKVRYEILKEVLLLPFVVVVVVGHVSVGLGGQDNERPEYDEMKAKR
jgi:hypothetical protein